MPELYEIQTQTRTLDLMSTACLLMSKHAWSQVHNIVALTRIVLVSSLQRNIHLLLLILPDRRFSILLHLKCLSISIAILGLPLRAYSYGKPHSSHQTFVHRLPIQYLVNLSQILNLAVCGSLMHVNTVNTSAWSVINRTCCVQILLQLTTVACANQF